MTSSRLASDPGPAVIARQIIDSSRYLTLATADGAGRPWACPVRYAHEDYTSFMWVSRPGARHSRNVTGWATVDVTGRAPHRLYRASASACYILTPRDQRLPVTICEHD